MRDQFDYHNLNEKVEKKLQQQKALMRYLFLGISVFMMVLFAFLSSTMHTADAAIMLLVGWFTTLVFFGLTVLFDSGLTDKSMKKQMVSQVISQEVLERAQAEMMREYEKPKRDAANLQHLADADDSEVMELSDDGELVPVQRKKS